MANLIILSGLPGSGKTYLARALAQAMPAAHVSSDTIREDNFSPVRYTDQETEYVFVKFHSHIKDWLEKRQNVIADATNLRMKNVQPLLQIAYALEATPYIFCLSTPKEERTLRIAKRTYPDPLGTIKASEKMERYEDLDTEIISGWLDGTKPVEDLVSCVLGVVQPKPAYEWQHSWFDPGYDDGFNV